MGSLVEHRGADVKFAMQDPALALCSLFRPITKGRRPGGLKVETEHGGLSLRFAIWQALDTRDQSVLLAAVGLAGMDSHNHLSAAATGPIGQQLWLDLEPAKQAIMDKALVVTTTRYALLQAAGIHDRGRNYGMLEDCLERLSMVGCRAQKDGYDWSMRLLSYAVNQDGTIHIALNARFANAIAGHHVRVSLDERRKLHGDAAQIGHAWLSAWLRPGRTNSIMVDNFAEKVWGQEDVKDATQRKRRERLLKAVGKIGTLSGWLVNVEGKGRRTKLTCTRRQIIEG